MSRYTFTASRITDGNTVFPDEIIIDTDEEMLTFHKGQLIGYRETKIRFGAIGCVSIKKHLLFADIYIETNGGKIIHGSGFTRSDASEIQDLLS